VVQESAEIVQKTKRRL